MAVTYSGDLDSSKPTTFLVQTFDVSNILLLLVLFHGSKFTFSVRQLADEQNSITDEQSSSSSASKLNGRAASPTEEDEGSLA